MAGSGSKRRSVRQAASRRRSVYVDPETDDDFEQDSEVEATAPLPPTPPPTKRRKPGPKRKPATRSKTKGHQFNISVGRKRKQNVQAQQSPANEFSGPSDHRIPAWTSLPLEILRDIFTYASQPMQIHIPGAHQNANWLIKTARTCRAFALPALEAFYYAPIIQNGLQLRQLFDLLITPPEEQYINYRVKVKRLQVDLRCVALAHGKSFLDFCDLVTQLPQLKDIELIDLNHLPPFRQIHKAHRWAFPFLGLLNAMEEHHTQPRSWRWSRDALWAPLFYKLFNGMGRLHENAIFGNLERLVVAGFNVSSCVPSEGTASLPSTSMEPAQPAEASLAEAICRLPKVRDVSFVCCDVIMNNFLLRLPASLQRLELTNCLEITSDMLRAYFTASGSQVRHLALNNNPALNFSFLTALKDGCPRLETLKMDLKCYSERDNTDDGDPLYDELLASDEVPTWPSSLQSLEFTHAQKLTAEAATNLFRSLVDSARDLEMLRRLVIHAHINIPWRDRVGFRDEWTGRLRRVYLRRSRDPVPYLGSFRQYRLWKKAQGIDDPTLGTGPPDTTQDSSNILPGLRELSHVLIAQSDPREAPGAIADSEAPRRSRRVAEFQTTQVSKPAASTDESDSAMSSDAEDSGEHADVVVQGLCDVVDIRIDNQRPRENEFTEGDFLDDEASGDEDWREDAEDNDMDDGYAW